MASKTDIANIALAKMREGRITSIESTTDSVAVVMAGQYDHALKCVLEEHRWNFAGARATLSRLGSDPEFGWDYQYRLPSDLIRLKEVNGEDIEGSSQTYEIEGSALLSNDTEVEISYIKLVTDVNLFSPTFTDALATKLAAITCGRITGDSDLGLALTKAFEMALAKAILLDAKSMGSREKNLRQRLIDSSGILNVRNSSWPARVPASSSSSSSSSSEDVEHGSDEW